MGFRPPSESKAPAQSIAPVRVVAGPVQKAPVKEQKLKQPVFEPLPAGGFREALTGDTKPLVVKPVDVKPAVPVVAEPAKPTFTGPGSEVIPDLTEADEDAPTRVDMGAISNETGEVDPQASDPMDQVLKARVDASLRDRAQGLLKDKSLRDVFSHGDSTQWVAIRQQQLLNDKFGANGPSTEAEREVGNNDAYWQAVDELATLATVNYTGGPVPLPLDKAPNSTVLSSLIGKQAEIIGSTNVGGKNIPVIRHETDAGWALDLLQIPQRAYVATGAPEVLAQLAFGKQPEARAAKMFDADYAKSALAERRSFSDIAKDTAPESELARAAVATGAAVGDVAFPDLAAVAAVPVKIAAKAAELAADTRLGVRALEETRGLRALFGATTEADAVAHTAAVERAELQAAEAAGHVAPEAAGKADAGADDLGLFLEEELSVADRVGRYRSAVENVTKQAEKFGAKFVAELERRAMAATGGEIATQHGSKEAVNATKEALESVVLDNGPVPMTTGDLLSNLESFVAQGGSEQEAERILEAVVTARTKAIRSIREDLTTVKAVVPAKVTGSLTLVKDAQSIAQKRGALASVVAALGIDPFGISRVEAAIRDGKVALEIEQIQPLMSRIAEQAGTTVDKLPLTVYPKAGMPVTVDYLARVDAFIDAGRKAARSAPDVAKILHEAVKPRLMVPRFVSWIGDAMNAVMHGANEAQPFEDAGLTKDIREAAIRAMRMVDAVISDVGKISDETGAARYLSSVPVRSKSGQFLVTSGKNHYALFAAAAQLGLVPASVIQDIATSFIRTGDGALSNPAVVDELSDHVLQWINTHGTGLFPEGSARDLMVDLREKTIELAGEDALDPNGWRRLTAGIAANGQQLPIAEELLGSGVVLTAQDRNAIMNAMNASVGTFLDGNARQFAGSIAELRAAEHEAMLARHGYDVAVSNVDKFSAWTYSNKADEADIVVSEVRAKLAASGEAREMSSLDAARKATAVSGTIKSSARLDPVALKPVVIPLFDEETQALLHRVTAMTREVHYIPTHVRDEIGKAISKAMSRATPAQQPLLALYKQGVTRGIWFVSPRYNLFNLYGDAEQTAMAHGGQVANKSTIRSVFQQAMSMPIIGQVLAITGKSHRVRQAASVAGDLLADPGKVYDLLRALKKGGSLRDVMDRVASLSEVNVILDGGKDVVRIGDRMFTGAKLRDVAVKTGVFDSQAAHLVEDEVVRTHTAAVAANKLKAIVGHTSSTLRESVQDVVEGIAERQRVGLFATLIEHGADPEEAGNGVVKALYDYKYSMADGDRTTAVKWALPWWAWQKNAYRQMTDTLLSPMGAYRVKVMTTLPKTAASWANYYQEQRDVDAFGVRVGAMDATQTTSYHRLVSYLVSKGLAGREIREALYSEAAKASSDGGIESWSDVTPELVSDWVAVNRYFVPEPTQADVPSYYMDRNMIRMRPTNERIKAVWESPTSSEGDYYAYLLPPSMLDQYAQWAGMFAGVSSSSFRALTGGSEGQSAFTEASSQIDPFKVPLVGMALTVAGGKSVRVPVSNMVGTGLVQIGMASRLPTKNKSGQVLTSEDVTQSIARGPLTAKFAITNPTLALAWQVSGGSSVDSQVQVTEALLRDPSWRTTLKFATGLPSVDIEPASAPVTEGYKVMEGERVIPVARGSIGSAPIATAPADNRSYEGTDVSQTTQQK